MAETIAWRDLPKFLEDRLGNLNTKTQDLFMMLGVFVDRETQVTFARIQPSGTSDQMAANRTMWKGYDPKTLHPTYRDGSGYLDFKKWNPRTGTDGSKGRYSAASKLNQKSGTFRKSFRMLELKSDSMTYGSDHPIAKKLLENRPAINYDETMQKQFKTLTTRWFKDNLFGKK